MDHQKIINYFLRVNPSNNNKFIAYYRSLSLVTCAAKRVMSRDAPLLTNSMFNSIPRQISMSWV